MFIKRLIVIISLLLAFVGENIIIANGSVWIKQEEPFADQVKQANTAYIIKYNVDLGGEKIVIPSGGTLIFKGGSISNGYLLGTNTQIKAKKEKVFDSSLNLEGNWVADVAYPEWFGAVGDGMADDHDAIQKAIASFSIIEFSRQYFIRDKLLLDSNKTLIGKKNSKVEISRDQLKNYIFQTPYGRNCENIIIQGIGFVGHCSHETDDETGLCAIELVHVRNIRVNNCIFKGFNKNIEITSSKDVRVLNNTILDATETLQKINGYGILIEEGENITILNNRMYNIERHGIYINSPKNVVVKKNYIEGQINDLERYSHWEGNIKINGARNILVEDNTLIGNYYGISLMCSFREKGFCGQYIRIKNNTIRNCIRNQGFGFGAITIPESGVVMDVVIENNIIENELESDRRLHRGLCIERYAYSGVDFSFRNIKVKGNIIRGFARKVHIALNKPFLIDGKNVSSGSYELKSEAKDEECDFEMQDMICE